jgi:predicted nucleic acid-binding protein
LLRGETFTPSHRGAETPRERKYRERDLSLLRAYNLVASEFARREMRSLKGKAMTKPNFELVTADTGPLIYLASVNYLHLLERIGAKVVIPDLVMLEAVVTGKPFAAEIDAWITQGIQKGVITIATTPTGEAVRLARKTDPSFRQKDGGERSIVDWLIDDVNGTDQQAIILYENGKVPAMLLRWNSDMNAKVVTTYAFLRVCEEKGLLDSSEIVWNKMVGISASINPANQETIFRRIPKTGG